jgi:hypothetical protein
MKDPRVVFSTKKRWCNFCQKVTEQDLKYHGDSNGKDLIWLCDECYNFEYDWKPETCLDCQHLSDDFECPIKCRYVDPDADICDDFLPNLNSF